MLAERGALDMDRAFNLLRQHARRTNRRLADLARDVVEGAPTRDIIGTAPTDRLEVCVHLPGLASPMALSQDEREQFFAESHVAALSVYAGDTRGPLMVPIWYQYTPGGEPWILTAPASRKARLIEANGFFSLMVERSEPTRATSPSTGRSAASSRRPTPSWRR